jgi:hypothetical protein
MANTALWPCRKRRRTVNESVDPLALHYKGVTITPGGFLAAEFVRRSRALASDVNTPFNSLTMPGASQSAISEFFGSGRQSRISMLAEGRVGDREVGGYIESDFLSAGVSSNNNQSNSYTLRQRQAWGQAAFDNGWTFTGGQMWSLVTETKHGMDNRTEALPMTIDPQYTVGFSWARQYGLRLSKELRQQGLVRVAMENPQATITSHNNVANFLVGSAGAGGGVYNGAVTTCTTSATGVTTCSRGQLCLQPVARFHREAGLSNRASDTTKSSGIQPLPRPRLSLRRLRRHHDACGGRNGRDTQCIGRV